MNECKQKDRAFFEQQLEKVRYHSNEVIAFCFKGPLQHAQCEQLERAIDSFHGKNYKRISLVFPPQGHSVELWYHIALPKTYYLARQTVPLGAAEKKNDNRLDLG